MPQERVSPDPTYLVASLRKQLQDAREALQALQAKYASEILKAQARERLDAVEYIRECAYNKSFHRSTGPAAAYEIAADLENLRHRVYKTIPDETTQTHRWNPTSPGAVDRGSR